LGIKGKKLIEEVEARLKQRVGSKELFLVKWSVI
jgi:hypothetical protein